MEQSESEDCLSILEDHLVRACPDLFTRGFALPTSTLSKVDGAGAEKICRLLPVLRVFERLKMQLLELAMMKRQPLSAVLGLWVKR